jgi:hypothetical protein
MDDRLAQQSNIATNQLPQSWHFFFYFSPPTWSAGTRGVAASVTT